MPKEVTYSLSKLVQDIEMGEIGLPDIQLTVRLEEQQGPRPVQLDVPGVPGRLPVSGRTTGSTATVRSETDEKQKWLDCSSWTASSDSPLFAVLKGIPVVREDFRKERIRIAFRPKDSQFEVADAATGRDPEHIADISELRSGSLRGTNSSRISSSGSETTRGAG